MSYENPSRVEKRLYCMAYRAAEKHQWSVYALINNELHTIDPDTAYHLDGDVAVHVVGG